MTQAKRFPPVPSKGWEDPEDSFPRQWALVAVPERGNGMRFNGSGYVHLKFYFTSLRETIPSEMLATWRLDTDSDLSDLEVYSQGDTDSPDRLYGFGVEYKQPFKVDVDKAVRMAGFLTKLEGRLRQMRTDEGTPGEDYGSYVVRVARALNVRYLIEPADPRCSYEEGKQLRSLYQSGPKGRVDKLDASELEYRLRSLIWRLWTNEERKAAEEKAVAKAQVAS